MAPAWAIALDVGGSSIKSGVINRSNHAISGFRTDAIDSYGSRDEILATLTQVIVVQMKQIGNASLSGVGIGFPGPFDYAEGVSRMRGISSQDGPGSGGKYDAICGLNLRKALRDRLGRLDLTIRFCNDAEAAIVGEAKYGAGQGSRRLIGVTLGTGFGSAFVSDGQRLRQGVGVPPDGWLFKEPVAGQQADDVFSTRGLISRLAAEGMQFNDLAQAAEAARNGNETVLRVYRAFGTELGIFLSPYALAFSANSVLVLGGIAKAFDLFGQSLARELPVPALPGALGAQAALLGAVEELASL